MEVVRFRFVVVPLLLASICLAPFLTLSSPHSSPSAVLGYTVYGTSCQASSYFGVSSIRRVIFFPFARLHPLTFVFLFFSTDLAQSVLILLPLTQSLFTLLTLHSRRPW